MDVNDSNGNGLRELKGSALNNLLSDLDLSRTNNMMKNKSKRPHLTGLTVGETA